MEGTPELWVLRPGQLPYGEAVAMQERLAELRVAGSIPDTLLLLEHPPTYTKGRRSEPGHLPMGEDWYRMQGIEVEPTDRGGQVTYHGPGQQVAYPIVSLDAAGGDVQRYVRMLEETMIRALGVYAIQAQVFPGLTGVWTAGEPPIAPGEVGPQRTPVGAGTLEGGDARKIGSIGIHLSRGIATHGLAVNVNNDLQPFEWIVPCAIDHVRMTSVSRELGEVQDMTGFATAIRDSFCDVFGMRPSERTSDEIERAAA